MDKGQKSAVRCIAAGSVIAGTPAAAGVIANCTRKGMEKSDLLRIEKGSFVTKSGSEVTLRGINLEPVPFGAYKDGEAFSENKNDIFDALAERFGNYGAREVFNRCYENAFTPDDIKAIAGSGLNCVNIPLERKLLCGKVKDRKHRVNFAKLDKLVAACRKAGIYAVLSFGCDDDCPDKDILKIWAQIADHYRKEPAVGAYNLLSSGRKGSAELYNKIIRVIRKKNDRHIVICEASPENAGFISSINDKNAAFGFSGSFSAVPDQDETIGRISDIGKGGTAVMAVGFYPADYEKAMSRLTLAGAGWCIGSFKGDMFCLYGCEKPYIDLVADDFEGINKKLGKDALGTKNCRENSAMSAVIKDIQ